MWRVDISLEVHSKAALVKPSAERPPGLQSPGAVYKLCLNTHDNAQCVPQPQIPGLLKMDSVHRLITPSGQKKKKKQPQRLRQDNDGCYQQPED